MEREKFINDLNQVLNENTIKEMEQARREMKTRMKRATITAIIIVLAIVIMIVLLAFFNVAAKTEDSKLGYIVGTALEGIVAAAIIIWNKKDKGDKYNDVFQNKVVKPLVKLLYNDWKYIPEEGIDSEEFSETGMYVYNEYSSFGLTYGLISNNYQFKMSNLDVSRCRYDDSTSTVDPVFHGLFMKIKMQKILPDAIYLVDGKVFKKEMGEEWKDAPLQLDAEQFGKKYILYSQDMNLAKNIFSDNVKQELLRYYQIIKQRCEVVIKEGHIYLMFPNTYTFGNIIIYENRDQMYQELYKQYYVILKLVFDIANRIIEEVDKT